MYQVGNRNKDGQPVAREESALDDIEQAKGMRPQIEDKSLGSQLDNIEMGPASMTTAEGAVCAPGAAISGGASWFGVGLAPGIGDVASTVKEGWQNALTLWGAGNATAGAIEMAETSDRRDVHRKIRGERFVCTAPQK